MSGLEVLGIILGAFPLAISAMEHYEESKKVAGTFYKIRRAHRKDFGRVKDCQLKFRLNMKELLLPLLADDIVTKIEYEQLLAFPGGPEWQEDHVEESLAERLGDCHERYIEILKEMEETMVLLCKATKVDDEQFQALHKSQDVSKVLSSAAGSDFRDIAEIIPRNMCLFCRSATLRSFCQCSRKYGIDSRLTY